MTAETTAEPKLAKVNTLKSRSVTERGTTLAQELAIQHFVLTGKQSAAYRYAYPKSLKWSDKSVHEAASKLFANAKVLPRVEQLQAEKVAIAKEKFNVDAEYVLSRHVEIDQMDVADILDDNHCIKPLKDWPKVWRQSISAIDMVELMSSKGEQCEQCEQTGRLKKIRWPDKVTNLEKLGKHVSVNAYRKQVGISDPRGGAVKTITADMSDEEAARIYKELITGG